MDHVETETVEAETSPDCCWVLVYFVQRRFGGPEEGGWYYEAGTAVGPGVYADIGMTPRLFLSWDDPEMGNFVQAMQAKLDESEKWNLGRPDLGSVLSKGRYEAMIQEGAVPPLRFPDEIPHYE